MVVLGRHVPQAQRIEPVSPCLSSLDSAWLFFFLLRGRKTPYSRIGKDEASCSGVVLLGLLLMVGIWRRGYLAGVERKRERGETGFGLVR